MDDYQVAAIMAAILEAGERANPSVEMRVYADRHPGQVAPYQYAARARDLLVASALAMNTLAVDATGAPGWHRPYSAEEAARARAAGED